MEVIELNHEVCYRNLDQFLEDVCPKSSTVALSSVRIRSLIPPLKSAMAVLSEQHLIIVQDIQEAIDYISADNLMLIDLESIKQVERTNGWLTLKLVDDEDIVLEESSFESELRQIGGFDTSFSTLCAALEEIVNPADDMKPIGDIEVAQTQHVTPPPSAPVKQEDAEEKPVRIQLLVLILLTIITAICAGIYFFSWDAASDSTSEGSTPALTPTELETEESAIDGFETRTEVRTTIEEDAQTEQSETPVLTPAGRSKVIQATSFRETIYGEVWPSNWINASDVGKSFKVKVTSKGSLYNVEFIVNGALKQTLFVVPDKERSGQLTNEIGTGKVNAYSNPSTDEAVHVDVINGTLNDLIEYSGKPLELRISVQSASYAAAFKFE